MFSTRSDYKLWICDASANNTSSSNPNPQKSFWRCLWMLRTPSKMKHFAWHACNDALPTMVNLLRRHIAASDRCLFVIPTQRIPFILCGAVRSWNNCGIILARLKAQLQSPPGNFSNLFSHFLQVPDDFRAEIFIITTWLLWNSRNALRLGL